jgi:hypothetical protein
MMMVRVACAVLLFSTPMSASAQPVETEIPGVTAELIELRQHEGVLRLAVRLVNTTSKATPAGTAIRFADITLIDLKGKTKYSGMKDPEGRFLAGPLSDAGDGGRWWVALPAEAEATIWLLFGPLPAGSLVSVQLPHMFPFENVSVAEGPSEVFSSTGTRSTPSGLTAKLVSAVRTKTGEVRVRLRIDRGSSVFDGPVLRYQDVALIRHDEKQLYPLLQDTSGNFVAQPVTDRGDGGRLWLNTLSPGKTVLMSLTFVGPADPVETVDLLLPGFLPIVGVEIVAEQESSSR